MSVNGISSSNLPLGTGLGVRDGVRQRPVAPKGTTVGGSTTPSTQTPTGTSQPLAAAAPAGTDPALWSILSPDERAHFAKLGAMGPLTYGRMITESRATPATPSIRGGRLDVRV